MYPPVYPPGSHPSLHLLRCATPGSLQNASLACKNQHVPRLPTSCTAELRSPRRRRRGLSTRGCPVRGGPIAPHPSRAPMCSKSNGEVDRMPRTPESDHQSTLVTTGPSERWGRPPRSHVPSSMPCIALFFFGRMNVPGPSKVL